MTVTINSGPIEATRRLSDYTKKDWPMLMHTRHAFIERQIGHDCRCVSQFVKEAEEMYEVCGFSSVNDMVRDGLGVNPEEMAIVVKWLELNDPKEAVPIRRILPEFPLGTHGGDRKSEDVKNQDDVVILKQQGNSADYLLARMQRDTPKVARRYLEGEFPSVRAAALAAGIIKKRSELDHLRLHWKKASVMERKTFVSELATSTLSAKATKQ